MRENKKEPTKATQSNNATHERRKYECEKCEWIGTTRECVRKKMPVSGSQIRKNVIKPAVQSADVTPKAEEKETADSGTHAKTAENLSPTKDLYPQNQVQNPKSTR